MCFTGKMCEFSGESTACDSNPCDNMGTCISLPDEQFFCSCTPGKEGDRCEHGMRSMNILLMTLSEVYIMILLDY